jgi:hypothetical protein
MRGGRGGRGVALLDLGSDRTRDDRRHVGWLGNRDTEDAWWVCCVFVYGKSGGCKDEYEKFIHGHIIAAGTASLTRGPPYREEKTAAGNKRMGMRWWGRKGKRSFAVPFSTFSLRLMPATRIVCACYAKNKEEKKGWKWEASLKPWFRESGGYILLKIGMGQ